MFIVHVAQVTISARAPKTARRESVMASKNADTATRIAEAFNKRDWDGIRTELADDCVFSDTIQDHKGPDGFVEGYNRAWVAAFSDAKMTDVVVHDSGDTVIVEFVGTGTNDGALGDLPPTDSDRTARSSGAALTTTSSGSSPSSVTMNSERHGLWLRRRTELGCGRGLHLGCLRPWISVVCPGGTRQLLGSAGGALHRCAGN
jgi:hypothetical protein